MNPFSDKEKQIIWTYLEGARFVGVSKAIIFDLLAQKLERESFAIAQVYYSVLQKEPEFTPMSKCEESVKQDIKVFLENRSVASREWTPREHKILRDAIREGKGEKTLPAIWQSVAEQLDRTVLEVEEAYNEYAQVEEDVSAFALSKDPVTAEGKDVPNSQSAEFKTEEGPLWTKEEEDVMIEAMVLDSSRYEGEKSEKEVATRLKQGALSHRSLISIRDQWRKIQTESPNRVEALLAKNPSFFPEEAPLEVASTTSALAKNDANLMAKVDLFSLYEEIEALKTRVSRVVEKRRARENRIGIEDILACLRQPNELQDLLEENVRLRETLENERRQYALRQGR